MSAPLLHTRSYEVEAYDEGDGRIRLRGRLQDVKPDGLNAEDDRPLTIHDMVVDVVVQLPMLEIVEAHQVMETHPHTQCPQILETYDQLIGLSIARGFTNEVRSRFGGPRGCTHITILLQAMAPVAIQAMHSMGWQVRAQGEELPHPVGVRGAGEPRPTREELKARFGMNLNTCHVWAEDGPMLDAMERGEGMGMPLWAEQRLREMGRDPAELTDMTQAFD